MARPAKWIATVDASTRQAQLAVRLYNDPVEPRPFEGFVVHIHLAWLYLLHAQFERDNVDFRYWDKNKKRRLVKVDGEPKFWELQKSVTERWPSRSDPVRVNIELFIRLRNRLEHRHAAADAPLMLALAGHAHAMLVNFDDELTSQFPEAGTMASRLRVPLFVGTFSAAGQEALLAARSSMDPDVQSFLARYFDGLDSSVLDDPRFEFRLRTSLELAPRDPNAMAIQFTRIDDMTEAQRAAVIDMGKQGQVIVRDRIQPVAGLGMMLPNGVVRAVARALPFEFKMHHFVAAYKHFGARPPLGVDRPEITNSDWCIYDEPTSSYRYSTAFVNHIVDKCATADGFTVVTGKTPKPAKEAA